MTTLLLIGLFVVVCGNVWGDWRIVTSRMPRTNRAANCVSLILTTECMNEGGIVIPPSLFLLMFKSRYGPLTDTPANSTDCSARIRPPSS
jgi:hypothetical protein